jgi:hypothetical protein
MAMYVSGTNLRTIFTFLLGAWWWRVLGAAAGRGARHPGGVCGGRRPGAVAGRVAARRFGRPPFRHRCPARAGDPARPGLHDDRGGGSRSPVSSGSSASSCRTSSAPRRRAGPPRPADLRGSRGAILLVAADLVARMLGDIPVGVVMCDAGRAVLPGPAAPGSHWIRAVSLIGTPILAIEGVTVAYGERRIVDDVSLSVRGRSPPRVGGTQRRREVDPPSDPDRRSSSRAGARSA